MTEIIRKIAVTEQNRTEQNRTEQNRTEQNRTELCGRYRYFTLLELIVAIAMIVILAGLLTGVLQSARKKAQRSAQSAQNVKILTAIEKFKDDFGFLPLEVEYVNCDGQGATCIPYPRLTDRQLPDRQNPQKNSDKSTLALAIAFSTVERNARDPESENFCDASSEPYCQDLKYPATWVGNYLAKDEVKVNAAGEIIDLWGQPLIYWTRYGEKDETVAMGDSDNYPPEYKASNRPKLPIWLIELWAAPNPPGQNWLNGAYAGYVPPAGSDPLQIIPVSGAGADDCYYFLTINDPEVGNLDGATIYGQNNNWYYAYPKNHPQNTSGAEYQHGGPLGSAGGTNLSVTYSGPANGFGNIGGLLTLMNATGKRDHFLEVLAETLLDEIVKFNALPGHMTEASCRIAAQSTDPYAALGVYNQITPNTQQRPIMAAVIQALRGDAGAAQKDWDLAAEIWSGGADKAYFGSSGNPGKWDGTTIDKTCLRLGAYRESFGGGIDNSRCLYGHKEDEDNIGGDLNLQKQ